MKVGDKLFLTYTDRSKIDCFDCTVIKIGRKYFDIEYFTYWNDRPYSHVVTFEIEGWREKTNYSSSYRLYISVDQYEEKLYKSKFKQALYKLSSSYSDKIFDPITLEDLKQVAEILHLDISF